MFAKLNILIFNCKEAILTCDDKMLTYIALANHSIPMPKTFSGCLTFQKNNNFIEEQIHLIERKLNYPIVIKECYGSSGNGIYLAKSQKNLKSILDIVLCKPHLFQEYIHESAGMDIRVIVIGGKVIGARDVL